MKIKVHYEEGEGLMTQSNCLKLLVCAAHILARISLILDKPVKETSAAVADVAKQMLRDGFAKESRGHILKM